MLVSAVKLFWKWSKQLFKQAEKKIRIEKIIFKIFANQNIKWKYNYSLKFVKYSWKFNRYGGKIKRFYRFKFSSNGLIFAIKKLLWKFTKKWSIEIIEIRK